MKISTLRISNTPNPPDWQIGLSILANISCHILALDNISMGHLSLEFTEREDLEKKALTNAKALPLRECLELCGRQVEWGAKTRVCDGGAALQVSGD